jgi:hypothetical protein
MVRNIMIVSALALAAPAFAQQTAPSAPAEAMPAPSAPADTSTQTAPAQADTAAQPATTAQAAPATDVASVVQAEFSTYDTDKSGDLNKEEFSKWVIALKTQAEGDKANPAELKKWATTAFAQADTDKSKAVSETELTTFLKG